MPRWSRQHLHAGGLGCCSLVSVFLLEWIQLAAFAAILVGVALLSIPVGLIVVIDGALVLGAAIVTERQAG